MIEAEEFNVDYKTLNFFANELSRQTKVKDVFQIEKILEPMGCTINDIALKLWEEKKFNYVEVMNEKDFKITICSVLGDEMKRFILLQGFAHYILHSMRGNKPCFVKYMSQGNVAREGLIFTLCLLIPDQLINRMKLSGMTDKEMSNFFRVPEMMIGIKLELLKKYIGEV